MATYSKEIVAGLRGRGNRVVFLHHGLPKRRGDSAPDPEDAVALRSLRVRKPFVLSVPGERARLLNRLNKQDFDLVHASFWFSSLDFDLPQTCHEAGMPIIATFHVAFDRRLSLWGGITNATYRLYAPTLSRCDRVVVLGESQLDILAALGVPRKVLRVVPNGVDPVRYSPGPSDWKQRLGCEQLFCYMGRLDQEKNVDALLGAFLDAKVPRSTHLVVLGSGTERRRLERSFRHPAIKFLGHVADVETRVAILRAADAFFLPSSVEGLSLGMLEAMSCGVATVATDVGCDGESLRGAGIVLDPVGLEPQLRLVIRQLVDMPSLAPILGRAGRQRVLERFTLSGNLDRLTALYSEVLAA